MNQGGWIVAVAAGFALAAPTAAGASLVEEIGSPIGVGVSPWWVAASDFDGDGRPDLAVANDEPASPTGTVSILLRQPLGGFTAEAGSPITVGQRPDSLVAGDFNADGRRDLAVANYVSSTVTVLLRKADNSGFEEEGSPVAVGTSPHAVAAGDFNGDGRTDLATTSHALSTVTVLLRKSDNSGFEEEAGSPVAVGTNPTQLALADFDGDGRLDIASANRGSDDVTVLLREADNSGFAAEAGTPPAAGDAPVGIVSADFDGDGRPDLALTGENSGDIAVLLRQAGGFAAAPGSPHPAGEGAYGITAADFNGDGRPDLAATAFEANSLALLHGTGTGDFERASFAPLPTAKGPLVLASADFDGDGRQDVAIPNQGANSVTIRLNRAEPETAPVPTAPAGCTPPADGRIALWRGEDSARDSVGGHDGSLENGGAYRNGVVGRAFSLAGSDDYLHVPDRTDLTVTGDVSFDAWVQIDDTNFGATDPYGVGGDRVIVAKPDATDTAVTYAFWIEGDAPRTAASAPLAFAAGPRSDPTTVVTSEDLAWVQDTWYHVAVVRLGNEVRFYRDGQLAGTATIGGTPAATAGAPVDLGGSLYDATLLNPLIGGLDEAGLWSRALTDAEVRALAESATGACATPPAPEPPPAPPAPVAPPRNVAVPTIVEAEFCRTALNGTRTCTAVPNTYECRTGTWEGRDPGIPFTYEWRRVTRSPGGGVTYTTEGTGRTYRAAAETRGQMALRSWTFDCVVTATNDGGSTKAISPERQLDPAYDPRLTNDPYGNFGIRGIDVFQSVQPNAGAQMYGFDAANTWPLNNGTGGQNPKYWTSTPFTDYPGGGTPTDWRKDGTAVDADPQQVPYDGVTLDTDKVAYAVVYVNMLDSRAAYPNLDLQLELSATRDGAPIPNSPAAVYATVRNPPTTSTPFVTAAQRGSFSHGVRMKLPATWLRLDDLDLKASIRIAPGLGTSQLRQCASDPGCLADDSFALRDVRVAVGAERPAQLLIQPVPMADGRQSFPSASSVVDEARHVLPGGSRMRVMQYVGTQDITRAVAARAGDGSNLCPATHQPRDCQMYAVQAVLDKWVADNPPRTPWPAGGYVQRYDVAMGVHDYLMAGTADKEPGFAWNGTIEYLRTGPAAAGNPGWKPGGPRMTVTARVRPLTAAAHELGHVLSMPHISDCPTRGDANNNFAPIWPPDLQGRLQSAKFDTRADQPPVVDTTGGRELVDFMSYCLTVPGTDPPVPRDAWISARNWNHSYLALRQLATRVGSVDRPVIARAVARAASARATAGPSFAVGSVSGDGGVITSVTPYDGDDAIPAPVADSPVRLRSLDAAGKVIAEAGVGVAESTSHHRSGPGGTFVGPVPEAAAAVELVRDGQVLHRLARTRAPRLRLLAPRRGERARRSLSVRWTAADPDQTPLDATIDYSPDGGRTWKNVFAGRSTGRARIPGRLLVASDAARLRVAVSDGFNEASAVSEEFRADGRPPVVHIERPDTTETLSTAGRSLLIASAMDDRDAVLRGRSITWYAGGRRLGSGERLYARLPAGRYVLRAVAEDRLGRTTSAGRRVRVAAEPLRLLALRAPATVGRGARRVAIRVRASEPATFAVAGRRRRVGTRPVRIAAALPGRPVRGVVRLRWTLSAPGRKALRGRIELYRG